MGFTAAELAEMARADAEIEASFCFTKEDLALSRELDRGAVLGGMDSMRRRLAEAQRQYREANRDKIAEGKREIRALRRRLGLTQKCFGDLVGVTQGTVSHWENIVAPANWGEIISRFTVKEKLPKELEPPRAAR